MNDELINCLKNFVHGLLDLTMDDVAKSLNLSDEEKEKMTKEFGNDSTMANIVILMSLSNFPYEVVAGLNSPTLRNENPDVEEYYKKIVQIYIYLKLISRFVPVTADMVCMLQYDRELIDLMVWPNSEYLKEKPYPYIAFVYFWVLKWGNLKLSYPEFVSEVYRNIEELFTLSLSLTKENKDILLSALMSIYTDLQNALHDTNLEINLSEDEALTRKPNRRRVARKVKSEAKKDLRGKRQ